MIPPRGCAFVCMTRRKEAAKAVDRMKGMLFNGSELRVRNINLNSEYNRFDIMENFYASVSAMAPQAQHILL